MRACQSVAASDTVEQSSRAVSSKKRERKPLWEDVPEAPCLESSCRLLNIWMYLDICRNYLMPVAMTSPDVISLSEKIVFCKEEHTSVTTCFPWAIWTLGAGYATISFVKRAAGMEVSQGIIAGRFLMRKGSLPGRPSAGEALRPSDSTARGGYDAGNQVSQLRESFSGG